MTGETVPQPSAPRASGRRGSRSSRRLTWGRKLLYRIAVPIGMGIIWLFWLTCRIVRVEGAERIEDRVLKGKPVVACYWHRHQLFCWRYLRQLIDRGARIGWLISASVDGEVPSRIARRMGGGIVFRGSTTSGGAEALRTMCKAIQRNGLSPAMTPDGPYGPRSVFKPGVVKIAQLSGAPLIPLAYGASSAWVLRTWDRFVIPKPFCRIVIAVGEPVQVPRHLDAAGTEEVQRKMERVLEELFQQARVLSAQASGSS
jgi:lysophospholipid acyltransferase (LPLAT)-like uncharacterized protein